MRFKSVTLVSALILMPAGIVYYKQGQPWPQFSLPSSSSSTACVSEQLEQFDPPQLVYANGVVEGRHCDVPLRFELAGRLASVEVAEGDQVEADQILARLDDTVWRHELAQAEAALAKAEADKARIEAGASEQALELARAEVTAAAALAKLNKSRYERAAKLAQSQSVAEQEMEDARGKYRIAVAEWNASRARLRDLEAPPRPHEIEAADAEIALRAAQVERARTTLAMTILVAPGDGTILRVNAEPGQLTGPDSADALVTMVDCSEIRVRAYVEELDALRVTVGQRAVVSADGLPSQELCGTVECCLPSMQPKTQLTHRADERVDVTVREVLIRLDDAGQCSADSLLIGLRVDVHIEFTERQNAASNRHLFRMDHPGRTQQDSVEHAAG